MLKRITDPNGVRAKLAGKDRNAPTHASPDPRTGTLARSVLRGHYNYYAVPGNSEAISAFRRQVIRHWLWALRAQPATPD